MFTKTNNTRSFLLGTLVGVLGLWSLVNAMEKSQEAHKVSLVPFGGITHEYNLVLAAAEGKRDKVEQILRDHPDIVDRVTHGGVPALVAAAANGHVETVRLLLDSKATIGKQGPQGNTALHWAVKMGHLPVITLLLEYGAKKDIVNDKQMTPCSLAKQLYRDTGKAVYADISEVLGCND